MLVRAFKQGNDILLTVAGFDNGEYIIECLDKRKKKVKAKLVVIH